MSDLPSNYRPAIFRTNDGAIVREVHGDEAFTTQDGAPTDAPATIADISAMQKLRHLRRALMDWQAKGRPLTTREIRKARQSACNACPYWNAQGNFWLGECRAPGCGCSRAKTWLATEKCPHPGGSRWPA